MRTIVGLCALTLMLCTGAFAQAVAGFGAITGTVTDANANDGLPDATLVLSNEKLGFQRTFVATDDGIFDMPALVPAPDYLLKITRKGYSPKQIKGLQVLVGQTVNLIIPMEREGGGAMRVEQYRPPRVDDNKNVISSSVTPLQIDSLPNRSRTLDPYVLLGPAVTQNEQTGVIGFRGEQFTNSVLLDGNDVTTTYYYNQPVIAPQVPVDAVSEMQVLGGAWPAELGHTAGGIINVATRSGTSGVHGDAYDFFAEKGWTAPDRYAPGFADGARRNQGGVSLGGSIWPGKVFGFANFEVLNSSSDGLFRVSNPTLTNTAGTAILPSNCKATAAQCTAAINFLNPLINVAVPRSLTSRSGFARIDYRRNQANNFSVEGNAMHRQSPDGLLNGVLIPDSGPAQQGTYNDEVRYAKAGYTRTLLDNMLNEARASWYHDRFSEYNDPKLLPSTGLLSVNIAGTPFGPNPSLPAVLSEQRYQLLDNFTLTAGSNTLKGGVDYERTEDNMYQPLNFHATYDYPSLTAFADDFSGNTKILKNYTDFSQGFGNPQTDLKPRIWTAYVQDTWKASQRFTITAGVHWEYTKIPQPIAADQNATYYQTGSIGYPKTDFSPRIGMAYRLDEKTVIRLGAGTYYQPFPGELMRNLYASNGTYQKNILVNPLQTGSPVYPVFFSPTAGVPIGTQEFAFASTKFHNPYSLQSSVEIERSLAPGISLTLGYIDSRGNKLWTLSDVNLINANVKSETYTIDNAAGTSAGTYTTNIFIAKPNYSHAYQVENEGQSRYNAVDAQLHARIKYGLLFHTSYTWSHATDDVSGPPVFGFFPTNTSPADFASDKGPSALDQRQRAVINFVWAPRLGASHSGAERLLLDGWQLSAIATLATGLPETPVVIVNGQQFNAAAMTYLSTLNGSGGWNRVPFEGVNVLRLQSQHVVDARITKAFIFTEQIRGMLMFEAFNALNTQFDTSLNTIAYSATLGVLRPVAGLGDGIASYSPFGGTNARRAQIGFRVTF
jgi:hypothetical protein